MTDPCTVGVSAVDPVTLVVDLEAPTSYFLQLLTSNVCRPVPRHIVEVRGREWATGPTLVSNGAFRLVDWEPEVRIRLARNRQYHGSFAGPNVEKLDLYLAPDAPTVYSSTGLDVLDLTFQSISVLDNAQRHPTGTYISGPALSTTFLAINPGWGPFIDPRVRRAGAGHRPECFCRSRAGRPFLSGYRRLRPARHARPSPAWPCLLIQTKHAGSWPRQVIPKGAGWIASRRYSRRKMLSRDRRNTCGMRGRNSWGLESAGTQYSLSHFSNVWLAAILRRCSPAGGRQTTLILISSCRVGLWWREAAAPNPTCYTLAEEACRVTPEGRAPGSLQAH